MAGSKEKYYFEWALSALRTTQARVGGRVTQDPTVTNNDLPLDHLDSAVHVNGDEIKDQVRQNGIEKNGGKSGRPNSAMENGRSDNETVGGCDAITKRSKRESSDSSVSQGEISFGEKSDDGEGFWVDSDDAVDNLTEGKKMHSGSPEELVQISKESDGKEDDSDVEITERLHNENDESAGEVSGHEMEGTISAGCELEKNVEVDAEVVLDAEKRGHDAPLDHVAVTIEPSSTELDETEADEDDIEWHDSNDGDYNSGDETDGSSECQDASSGPPEDASTSKEVSTQTRFSQGFLTSFRKHGSVRLKRCHSEPLRTLRGRAADKRGNLWHQVYEWTRRRRSSRPSLRGYIQGRGGGLVIPGRSAVPPQNQIGSPVTFLQAYIDVMYYLAVSTREVDQRLSWKKKVGPIAQKIGFWMLAVFSIGYSIDVLKFCTIEFLDDGKLHDYVQLGFLLVYGITRIYSILLHGFRNKKVENMVKSMNDATLGISNHKYVCIIAKILGGGSLILACFYSVFGNLSFKQWSWKNVVLSRAYEMGHTLFIWSATDYQNATDKMDVHYSSDMNLTAWILAIPEVALGFCGSLQDFVLGDLMVTSAASLFSNTSRYVKGLKSKHPINVSYEEFKDKWNEYQVIAQASDNFYETCGTLLTLFHIYNLLQLTIVLRLMLVKKTAHVVFVTTLVNVIKSMITYVYAIKIADKNQTCRNWVRSCAFHSLANRREKRRKLYMQAILMLDEMKDNPLGFGKDELFINKGFLITFLGMAASLFVMIAEYAEESGKSC